MVHIGLNVDEYYLELTLLIIDFSNFFINMCSGIDVNKNVNLWITLIFVGTFHPSAVMRFLDGIFNKSF